MVHFFSPYIFILFSTDPSSQIFFYNNALAEGVLASSLDLTEVFHCLLFTIQFPPLLLSCLSTLHSGDFSPPVFFLKSCKSWVYSVYMCLCVKKVDSYEIDVFFHLILGCCFAHIWLLLLGSGH